MNVWRGETLLGAGAAAAGFNGRDRYNFREDIKAFVAGEAPEFDRISAVERMLEIFAVNLRTTAGWQKDLWEKLYPGSWDDFYRKSLLASSNSPGEWLVENDRIALTEKGLLFWDDAAMEILSWID